MEKKMENVLITGGAGFIGSHLSDLLIENNYNVIIADNLSSGFEYNINKNAKFYNVDVNSADLEKVFQENKIDYVFHFAAQPSVSFSTSHPDLDAKENILGSINVLKFSKKYNIKKFITASTAAVYGVPQYLPVDENHTLTCLSFYGISKLTMEKYVKLFGIDYVIFRFANVYGPRQSAHGEAGVVAIFADKMKNNIQITIDGDGEQTRDFVYVADIAQVCLKAIQNDVKNEIINVSMNTAISINKLFEIMGNKCNYKIPAIHGEERTGDIKHSVLDNKKCQNIFNFIPKTIIEEGLGELVRS
jgi:UDP-glucose 4-epimerase